MVLDVVVVIAEYKKQLVARGYAPATIESYGKNLDFFSRYLAERQIVDMRKISHRVIVDYRERVMSEPVGLETKALKIRPVKRLFEYLVATHRLLINPTEGIVETCRKNRKMGTVLTVEEVKKLLAQPNLSVKAQIRDRAIMEVLYSSGIRLDELVSLAVYHPDLKDRVLYVRKGKGKKQRVVPLGKDAVKYLKEYLEKIRPHYAKKNPTVRTLFLNHSGHPLRPESVRQAIRGYRIRAGIKKAVSPHTVRRTCATHLLQRGADIRHIQKLLGHNRLSTNQVYTRVTAAEVKRTHDQTHPGKDL